MNQKEKLDEITEKTIGVAIIIFPILSVLGVLCGEIMIRLNSYLYFNSTLAPTASKVSLIF